MSVIYAKELDLTKHCLIYENNFIHKILLIKNIIHNLIINNLKFIVFSQFLYNNKNIFEKYNDLNIYQSVNDFIKITDTFIIKSDNQNNITIILDETIDWCDIKDFVELNSLKNTVYSGKYYGINLIWLMDLPHRINPILRLGFDYYIFSQTNTHYYKLVNNSMTMNMNNILNTYSQNTNIMIKFNFSNYKKIKHIFEIKLDPIMQIEI